jgi:4-hydroxy-tetrahydrodipicolinate synthase
MKSMRAIGRHVAGLAGYAPALPTPFHPAGTIDFESFEAFCELQLKEGAAALVVCGTTGEAPTLSPQEQRELIRLAATVARGRIPVIAGAGSNSTRHAIELTREAQAAGADAVLSVVPYYNKPTQAGIFEHFRAIAASTGLPVILYDVPSRTACGLADQTIARLAEQSNIIGLKDATGDLARPMRLAPLVGPEFRLLSGDDATATAFTALGGHGCISVTSNVVPRLCRSLFLASRNGEAAQARELAQLIAELTDVLFHESNPAPVKYALSRLGLMSPALRLPMVLPSQQTQREVSRVLAKLERQCPDQMTGNARGMCDGLSVTEVA